jgi:chaperone required for assembly of F1-ATPase
VGRLHFGNSAEFLREESDNMTHETPIDAARRAARPTLRQRFYVSTSIVAVAEGHAVQLDGKPVMTPARRVLAVPAPALAAAIGAEWDAQREAINPAEMPLTRLVNVILDGIAQRPQPVAAEIAKYLASDLLFYRAASPPGLVERQRLHWDPVLSWAADTLGAGFEPTVGVTHVTQREQALKAAALAIPDDAWRLGAVHSVTTLTGSALLALALARGRLSVEHTWEAANVDEDWNMEQWGRDELALERRGFRLAELEAAATVLRCVTG